MPPPWNRRDLQRPPTLSCPNLITSVPQVMIKDVNTSLQEGCKVSNTDRLLASELFVLSKLVYKGNVVFGKQKGFQFLKRVEQCLKRLKEDNLKSCLSNFEASWTSAIFSKEGDKMYLPSRQMLEYVLIRLMGTGYLLHQTVNFCVNTYKSMMEQMAIGMNVATMMVYASTASRIWILCRTMKKEVIRLYDTLYPLKSLLVGAQVEWLPPEEQPPSNLKEWLGPETGNIPKSTSKLKPDERNLELGEKVDVHKGEVKAVEQDSKHDLQTFNQEDTGVKVSRDSFSPPKKSFSKKKKKR